MSEGSCDLSLKKEGRRSKFETSSTFSPLTARLQLLGRGFSGQIAVGKMEGEEGMNEDAAVTMEERVLAMLGTTSEYAKRLDGIVFDMERVLDSKPAVLLGYDVSFERLERFAPPGLCIVEIAGKKILVNLAILDRRMPWGPDPASRQNKPPLIMDISPGLAAPRLLNAHDLPHTEGPDNAISTVGNSRLYYMTSEICDMMTEIRQLIADGERVIEKRRQWHSCWCPATIWGCLMGLPVVFWSDSESEKRTCLSDQADSLWEVEWIDGEARLPVYSFLIPHSLMTASLKAFLQRWTDSIFDRHLPHQSFYMLQTRVSPRSRPGPLTSL
ncbi:hypothetical protein BV898_11929 [Hypsibius exemplaris]|uniref:Uncharacterized protein n=1 Tax=Hypsibius exemplaris TaxID=2072580 RepID=A0A1W0WF48_HYPEX|nr:hypothetical protein BV898_11929 [Hypsibius exemplaris]